VIILQTLPAVAIGLFTRWFHRVGLIAGWAAGMVVGFWTLWTIPQVLVTADGPQTIREHFGGSAFKLSELGLDTTYTIYAGFVAVIVNLLVAAIVTAVVRRTGTPDGADATSHDDYVADRGDEDVRDLDLTPPAATATE